MATHEFHFALLVAGLDVDDDTQVESFYAYDLHDATLEDCGDYALATFYREAPSPETALDTAIHDVQTVVAGARVVRVDDQLVNVTDIAELACRTPENVRQFASGARGPRGFPAPAGVVGKGIKVWRWAEVRPWLAEHDLTDDVETLPPELIVATNARLAASKLKATVGWRRAAGTAHAGRTFTYTRPDRSMQPQEPMAADVAGHSDSGLPSRVASYGVPA